MLPQACTGLRIGADSLNVRLPAKGRKAAGRRRNCGDSEGIYFPHGQQLCRFLPMKRSCLPFTYLRLLATLLLTFCGATSRPVGEQGLVDHAASSCEQDQNPCKNSRAAERTGESCSGWTATCGKQVIDKLPLPLAMGKHFKARIDMFDIIYS